MYVKSQTIRKANGKSYTYYRLVESYREQGKVKHRILGELGSLSREEAEKLARRFVKIAGVELGEEGEGVEVNGSEYFGAPLLVEELMRTLGLDCCVRGAVAERRVGYDVVAVLKVMLSAHLFKSGSRAELAVWDWQQKLFGHGQRVKDVSYHQLLRGLEVLVKEKDRVEEALFFRLVDLFSVNVDLVFYDLTSPDESGEGRAQWSERLKRGYSRDSRGDCKQIVIGLVVTREGFPVTCRVFDGNTLDEKTLGGMVEELKGRFRVERCLWVSDTGLLSERNLLALERSGYEYILGAGSGTRLTVRAAFARTEERKPDQESHGVRWWSVRVAEGSGERYLVLESEGRREKTTAILERRLEKVRESFEKLARRAKRGVGMEAERIRIEAEKALHQSGVRKYFSYRAERGALTWEEDVEAVEQRKREAGKYALRVKTELPAEDVVRAYRTLLACEDAFRVLKDELDLRPLWHQCDVNVEGHVLLAMWSYLLYKTLEVKLEQSRVETTAARALQAVKEVKAVEVTLRERPVWKLMKVSKEAEQVFAAIGIEDLKGRFHQWAKDAPPFHYQPRLYPYPKPEA